MTADQKTAERMRRTALKEAEALPTSLTNAPANYLPPSVISSLSSVKKDKIHFETIIAKTLMEIIMNADNPKDKLAAIDRYVKLTQTSQFLIKNGNKTAAIESSNDGPTTLNIDLSSHVNSDEPAEEMTIASRDLVAEKNAKMFAEIEDADFEVIQ